MAHNVKLLVAYDGTHYLGWQKTPTGRSIEGDLTAVLEQVLQQKVHLQAASRTDAGVHADGQVVNFFSERDIDCNKLLLSLNSLLCKEIAVLAVAIAAVDFHPTLDAIEKEYRYHLCYGTVQRPQKRHYSWHYPRPMDLGAMHAAAAMLTGTHDFAAFCNVKKNGVYETTVRTVAAIEIDEEPEKCLCFKIRGPNFLYKMVRNLVGTLVYVGCGKLQVDDIPKILKGLDRTKGGITAPAHGLTLFRIAYR